MELYVQSTYKNIQVVKMRVWKPKKWFTFLFLVTVCFLVWMEQRTSNLKQFCLDSTIKHTDAISKPLIILWYIPPRYVNNTPGLEPLPGCDVPNCYTTTNRNYMCKSQVVIFNAELTWQMYPPERNHSDQVWIFHNQEPNKDWWINSVSFRNTNWRNKFNWTMWYRRDADFYAPYGVIVSKSSVSTRNWNPIVKEKENKVAWMVSNCYTESKREMYVELLQKYVHVDIYGKCGENLRARDEADDFKNFISKKYKFYLSFENVLCEDYISEKFIYYYQSDAIMVVRGGGNYTSVAPDGTYINTGDFNSVRKLGEHLLYLMNNDEAYIEILEKKDQYTSHIDQYKTLEHEWYWPFGAPTPYVHFQYEKKTMCEMCKRGKTPEKYRKSIDRIDKWFEQKKCYPPSDLH